jgi:flagellar assembly protein FliH
MSKLISNEDKSAYERWELPNVDDGTDTAVMPHRLLTAGQLEKIQKLAHEEGYQQGRRDGFATGKVEAEKQINALKQILELFQAPLVQLDDQVVKQLVDMAILIAAQVIRRELRIDPGQVVAVVRACVKALPVSATQVKLFLHPEDAGFVRSAFSIDDHIQTWKIIDDPVMTRGGCRVETQYSKIDATVENQLNRIIANLLGGEREDDSASRG